MLLRILSNSDFLVPIMLLLQLVLSWLLQQSAHHALLEPYLRLLLVYAAANVLSYYHHGQSSES
jgi:hypothetical protein